jgi:short chain dehydrogenase
VRSKSHPNGSHKSSAGQDSLRNGRWPERPIRHIESFKENPVVLITGPLTGIGRHRFRFRAGTAESYAATFETNVLGVVLSMKHEVRVMQAQGNGSIINLSSTMGHRGAPEASLYTASKQAVKGLTNSRRFPGRRFNEQPIEQ